MSVCAVTTQAELDAALADSDVDEIDVGSSKGVWLYLSASDSATVSAYDSATVSAYGSATVRAYGSATVSAGQYVAVHLHSQRVTVEGGVVIDTTSIDKHTAESWCSWQAVPVEDGTAIVYKAVDADLRSGHHVEYPIGETVTASDWVPSDACGAGLHFGPTPVHADAYYNGNGSPRFLACRVTLADAVGISGGPGDTAKMKAKSCVVLHEVDVHGRRLVPAEAVS
jgi:hypothetical protein